MNNLFSGKLCFRDLFGKKVKLNKNPNVEVSEDDEKGKGVINPPESSEEPKITNGVGIINPDDLNQDEQKDPVDCEVETNEISNNEADAHEVEIDDFDDSYFLPTNEFIVLQPRVVDEYPEEDLQNADV